MEDLRENCPFESFGRIPGKQRQAISVSSLRLSFLSLSRYYDIFPSFLSVGFSLFYCVLAFLCFFRLVSCRSFSRFLYVADRSLVRFRLWRFATAAGGDRRGRATRSSPRVSACAGASSGVVFLSFLPIRVAWGAVIVLLLLSSSCCSLVRCACPRSRVLHRIARV